MGELERAAHDGAGDVSDEPRVRSAERILAPVIRFGETSFVLAVPEAVPATTVAEFVDYAKAHEGELSYAGSAVGSLVHLVSERFKLDAGIDVQMIPYTGQPPAIADLLANRVQFMVIGVSLAKPLIEQGKLKGACHFRRGTLGVAARRADDDRGGLSEHHGQQLGGIPRAGGDAGGDHRQDQRDGGRGRVGPGDGGASRKDGLAGGAAADSGGVRGVREGPDRGWSEVVEKAKVETN